MKNLDRTFCADDCGNTSCYRNMNDKEREYIQQTETYVSYAHFKDSCVYYRKPSYTHKEIRGAYVFK